MATLARRLWSTRSGLMLKGLHGAAASASGNAASSTATNLLHPRSIITATSQQYHSMGLVGAQRQWRQWPLPPHAHPVLMPAGVRTYFA